MDAERAGERLDRGEQPLLEPGDEQGRGGLLAFRLALEPLLPQLPVLVEEDRQPQLGGVGRQAVEVDLPDDPLGKPAGDGPEVFLEPADHDGFEDLLGPDGDAPAEALRVEDFQQGGEAVRVAVVGRGREEQPVLEPPGQVADGAGDLRVDGVFRAAGRGGVVGLVEDQQRAGPEVAEPVAQRGRVRLVDQQSVRDQESRVGRPGIDAVASLLPDPGDVLLVEDLEDHAEAVLQLFLPLEEHGRRAGDDDVLDLLAEQQFAGDQAGLDRLAEADVVGDEEVYPRQAQGFLERLQLVGVDPDAGPEGRLEEVRVGRGHAVPLQVCR